MSLLKKYQKASKQSAKQVLETACTQLDAMDKSYTETFTYPSLSAASVAFGPAATLSSNEAVAKGVAVTLDVLSTLSLQVQTIEQFLHLHIPQMEDGNNFGVTIQLALLKQLSEFQEAVAKHIDTLAGYASARADALEKLKLPSVSKSVTKSTSVTTTDGKQEDKTAESTEEKATESDTTGPAYASRVQAVVAVDVLYYSKAQRAFQSSLSLFLAALDCMDKNQDKLEKPKGSGGFTSMY
eukprot:Nitzschia sp. Nitz4//scaffold23_size168460//122133//123035//NITZ4_002238-RA/size168460-processed-gene-0.232-mRNA-1//1//CDS//3329543692//1264//frame0